MRAFTAVSAGAIKVIKKVSGSFYSLEKLHRLVDGYRQVFNIGGRSLLLIQEDGQRYLLENRCPHAGHPLHDSTYENGSLRCPLHGIQFHLESGLALNVENFPVDKCLMFFRLSYRDNEIGVML